MLRIVFAGTAEFALPTLEALARSRNALVGVLTQPDRPAGRGRSLHASPVKQRSLELGLALSQPSELKSPDARATLTSWAPDVLVVAAYGLILPRPVLALPRLGCINVHASLLPRWRGAAPIQRAILAGDSDSGVTIMQMEAGLDTGPVLAVERVALADSTTAGELQERLARLGAELLQSTLEALQTGAVQSCPQSEHGVTYAPKIDKREALIDWDSSAEQIARQVRAFNPWPIAETIWRGAQLRIWEAGVWERPAGGGSGGRAEPCRGRAGTVLGLEGERLLVACGRGVLGVTRLQRASRRIMAAGEFMHAAHLSGECLGV